MKVMVTENKPCAQWHCILPEGFAIFVDRSFPVLILKKTVSNILHILSNRQNLVNLKANTIENGAQIPFPSNITAGIKNKGQFKSFTTLICSSLSLVMITLCSEYRLRSENTETKQSPLGNKLNLWTGCKQKVFKKRGYLNHFISR